MGQLIPRHNRFNSDLMVKMTDLDEKNRNRNSCLVTLKSRVVESLCRGIDSVSKSIIHCSRFMIIRKICVAQESRYRYESFRSWSSLNNLQRLAPGWFINIENHYEMVATTQWHQIASIHFDPKIIELTLLLSFLIASNQTIETEHDTSPSTR